MIGRAPICLRCSRLHPLDDGPPGTPETCDAYPQGIPEMIWRHGYNHQLPYEGDGGVRFELKDGAELPEHYR